MYIYTLSKRMLYIITVISYNVNKVLCVNITVTYISTDLGGSSKHSNESFED